MKGRHTWIRTAWAALWIAAGITVSGIGASAETVQESTEVMESETLLTEGESLTEESSVTEEREIPYIHDPRDNPKAMKDIVYDPTAVYCFAPDPNSTRIGTYAEDDWTDPEAVEARRKERIAYHESISELYQIIDDMLHQAKRLEEIARAVSQRRNELRLEAVKNNPDELARTKQSNLDAYGHEEGPTPDELYEKYGSWQTVLEKAMGTNQGVDACVGLYDEYYDYYDIEDQVMETAAPEASAAGTEAAGTSVTENASQAVQSTDAVQSAEAVQTADEAETIPYWTEDSEVMKSIVSYVAAAEDETSAGYVPEEDRIAVFDFDGTLYGELFPTYFDTWLMLRRVLHDDTVTVDEETKQGAAALEEALLAHQPEPEKSISTSKVSARVFKDMTVDEYRDYVRSVMELPVEGFEGMTYQEGFYQPMVALVQYLSEHGFTVFISSGSERACLRELIEGTLDAWVPSYRVIGSTYSFAATGQGDEDGKDYTLSPEDKVVYSGEVIIKNQKMNKVTSIINEIGKTPVLVFGNSSGDLAMGQYAVSNEKYEGKAYMLLCDDAERDYGKTDVAQSFAEKCDSLGFTTVSMKNDFDTIYGYDVTKADAEMEEVQEEVQTEMQEENAA